jgi:hypothetical protein
MGHEYYKKGLGFIARAPSFFGSRRIATGAEEPGWGLLCVRSLLLWEELPHAFVTFLNA